MWALLAQGSMVLTYSSSTPFSAFGYTDDRQAGYVPDGSYTGWADQVMASGFDSQAIVTDVEVTLQISGGSNGDLYAYLSHGGLMSVLLNRPGKSATDPFGYADAGMSVQLSDQSPNGDIHWYQASGGSIAGGIAWQPDGRNVDPLGVTGSEPRNNMLSVFSQNSANANGAWTLFIADLSSGDQSCVTAWSVQITGGTSQSVPEPSVWVLILLGASLLLQFRRR